MNHGPVPSFLIEIHCDGLLNQQQDSAQADETVAHMIRVS